MTLRTHHAFAAPDRLVVHVLGRLDAMTYGEFDQALHELLPKLPDGGTVVVDLNALDYISSAGLRSFAKIRKSMRLRNGHTLLLNPQPQVQKVFEIVKAVPVNEIFTTTQELDAYLDRMQRRVTEGEDADD